MGGVRDNISFILALLDRYSSFLKEELEVFSHYKKDISPFLKDVIINYIKECALLEKEILDLKGEILLFKKKIYRVK